jgi:Fe-S-cluster containining protein
MVGEPERHRRIVAEVAVLYDWIDTQLRQDRELIGECEACGACCDFVNYDHVLFVTPPELVYLAAKLNASNLRQMAYDRCPYQEAERCTIHLHRFSGCRIFCCDGDREFQAELTETVLRKLKSICQRYEVPYQYADLGTALATFPTGTCQSAAEPCPEDRRD